MMTRDNTCNYLEMRVLRINALLDVIEAAKLCGGLWRAVDREFNAAIEMLQDYEQYLWECDHNDLTLT